MTRIHTFIDHHADTRPDAPALRDSEGLSLDWAAYRAASAEAAALLAERGVGAGDRIMVVAENCAAVPACVFAASRLGAIVVPVNARMISDRCGWVWACSAVMRPSIACPFRRVSARTRTRAPAFASAATIFGSGVCAPPPSIELMT